MESSTIQCPAGSDETDALKPWKLIVERSPMHNRCHFSKLHDKQMQAFASARG